MRLAAWLAATVIATVGCTWGPEQAESTPSGSSAQAGRGTETPVTSPTPSPTPSPSLNVTFGMYGQPHCPKSAMRTDNLVLAQDRLTYSAAEIGRIAAAMPQPGPNVYRNVDPALLEVVPGATTDVTPTGLADPSALESLNNCRFEIDVTNTGTSAVQIPRVGLRLTHSPTANRTSYRLIDFCSVLQVNHWCGPEMGHGPQPCSVYAVAVALQDQPVGTDFMSAPVATDYNANQPCPQVVIKPQDTVTFVIGVYSTSPLIYRASPVLYVITATAQGAVALQSLDSNFVFADPKQFACYRVLGSTFVVWRQGAAALDAHANEMATAWCV